MSTAIQLRRRQQRLGCIRRVGRSDAGWATDMLGIYHSWLEGGWRKKDEGGVGKGSSGHRRLHRSNGRTTSRRAQEGSEARVVGGVP